jgi:DNA-binding Lrp family transcriptional regulator
MVTAFVLINVERSQLVQAAQDILKLDGITEVYSVAGEFDLVAVARVKVNEELAGLMTEGMIAVKGVTRTKTLIAFRQYSRFDLERMFSLGA